MKGCGKYLKGLDVIKLINSTESPIIFSQHQSAALLFLHISKLLIYEVSVTSYYGFAVFAINPLNAFLSYSNITHSYGGKPGNNKAFVSGIFLLFTDIVDVLPFSPLKVYVHQTVFATNHEYTQAVLCPELKHKMKHIPITNASAAGLTVYYIQKKFSAEVNIFTITFHL